MAWPDSVRRSARPGAVEKAPIDEDFTRPIWKGAPNPLLLVIPGVCRNPGGRVWKKAKMRPPIRMANFPRPQVFASVLDSGIRRNDDGGHFRARRDFFNSPDKGALTTADEAGYNQGRRMTSAVATDKTEGGRTA